MKNKIIELLKIKSIITLMIISVFSYLSIIQKIDTKEFLLIAGMIITYYFSKTKGE